MTYPYSSDFFTALERLIAQSRVIIDRPRGSAHPRYPQVIYPLDYGYLENTASMDGSGIGVFIDSSGEAKFFNWMEFTSESAAEAWINSQGGYTPPTSGTGT